MVLVKFPYESSWWVSILPLALWRRWETFPTLCEIIRRQIRAATGNSFMKLILWVFIVSTRYTEKKKEKNSAWRCCSLVRYLLGPGDIVLMLGVYIWTKPKLLMSFHYGPTLVLFLVPSQRLIGNYSEFFFLYNYKKI